MTKASFLGTGWSFPPRFSENGVSMVSDEEDIEESLRILLSTHPGERVMRPDFGCGIRGMVFEHIDESTKSVMTDSVRRAILFHEPRVTVERVEFLGAPDHDGIVALRIEYKVDTTNNRRSIVYPFYLSEGTDVVL